MHISPPPVEDNHLIDEIILKNFEPNSTTLADFVENDEFISLISKPFHLS